MVSRESLVSAEANPGWMYVSCASLSSFRVRRNPPNESKSFAPILSIRLPSNVAINTKAGRLDGTAVTEVPKHRKKTELCVQFEVLNVIRGIVTVAVVVVVVVVVGVGAEDGVAVGVAVGARVGVAVLGVLVGVGVGLCVSRQNVCGNDSDVSGAVA